MFRPPHPPWYNYPNNIRWIKQAMKFIIISRSVFLPFKSKYPPKHSVLKKYSSLKVRDQVSHPYSTTGKITVVCILMYSFLYMRRDDKRFWTEC
jgi:hypothetical protein